MKNIKVLHGILFASLILTGCSNPKPNSSNNSSYESNTSVNSGSSEVKGEVTSIYVDLRRSVTSFELNSSFVEPLVIGRYENGSEENVTSKCTFSGFSSETKGEKTINVTFVDGEVTLSTSYKVKITDITIGFTDLLNQFTVFQANELSRSNSANRTEVQISGETTDTTNEVITNYADYSSSGVGSYERKTKGEIVVADTYKTIKTKMVDKYNVDDQISSFDMFVSIKDFDKDASTNYYYSDKVSKQFILNSKSEAEEAGLSSTMYILKSDFASNASANLTNTFFQYFVNYAANNIYLETLEYNRITVNPQDNDTIKFDFDASYSYDADGGNKITVDVVFSYTTNKDKSQLLDYSYSYIEKEVNSKDPSDNYQSGVSGNGTISYGTKTSEKVDILNVEDYFVRTITEVKLKGRNSNFDDVDVDPSNISLSYSYLFGYASVYFPKKAVDTELTVVKSSNTSVVTIESGKFKVAGVGTAKLTFSYYQKIDGIYELAYKDINVTITEMKVESVAFGIYDTNSYQYMGLSTTKTYDWPIYINPAKADPTITATSSNESVLKVEIVKEKEIRLIPVGKGKAIVTITSVNNPLASATKEFNVIDPALDLMNYLTTHSFKHSSPYGYSFELNFKADGTGTRHMIVTETGVTRDDTFNFTLTGNVVKFSNFSSDKLDDNSYVRGTIVNWLDRVGEPLGIYAETTAKGQPFYEISK